MHTPPTVIVLAHTLSEAAVSASALDSTPPYGALQAMLNRVLASELPMVLVAYPNLTEQARRLIPGNCIVELSPNQAQSPCAGVAAIVAGVHASAQSDGWLVLPADMPMLQPSTLRLVAQALRAIPVALPQFRGRRGHPMGFGRELFSELIRLEHDRDLYRLMSRYPCEDIEVNDPGVVLHHHEAQGLLAERELMSSGDAGWLR